MVYINAYVSKRLVYIYYLYWKNIIDFYKYLGTLAGTYLLVDSYTELLTLNNTDFWVCCNCYFSNPLSCAMPKWCTFCFYIFISDLKYSFNLMFSFYKFFCIMGWLRNKPSTICRIQQSYIWRLFDKNTVVNVLTVSIYSFEYVCSR